MFVIFKCDAPRRMRYFCNDSFYKMMRLKKIKTKAKSGDDKISSKM